MQQTLGAEPQTAAAIVPLDNAGSVAGAGGKARRLGQLLAAGEHVPDGFCLIGSGDSAIGLALAAYRTMGEGARVAVRSSASAEDGIDASFAGQFDTVLNVSGDEALAAAIRACWQSLSAERVAAYVDRRGLTDLADGLRMSVLVQRMVPARAAGVAFSADPLLGTRDVVVIHAVHGLGDRLVSGEVSPDRYRVTAADAVQVEATSPGAPVLANREALQIAAMVRRVAEADGAPQDIEWAIDADGLWLLQARPMTALPPETTWESPVPGAKWIKDLQAAEWATEPLSPLGETTTFEAMTVARETYRGWPPIPRSFEPGHAVINGWLYMRLGGPMWTVLANIAGATLSLITGGLDGHGRVQRRWTEPLAELDEWSHLSLGEMDATSLHRHADRLLGALGWWWVEVSFFASLVRVGQLMVGSRPALPDPGALFRGNDSLLLESERALRRAATDPAEMTAYLSRFGHMVESADPIHPTLAESPEAQRWTLVAARADREGPDVRLGRSSAKRAEAEKVIRAGRGPRAFFTRRAVAAGQSHAAHADDAVFHFQRVLAALRATFLAQGRHLADAGVIAAPDDVFYLTADELWMQEGTLGKLVETRRARRAGQKKLTPPPIIPPADDASWATDPMLKRMPAEMKAQILGRGSQVRDGRHVVVGSPASPGIAKGLARVISGPPEFGRFQPGDILVAHATSPIWTPLLAIAAAAVTEVGGPFAHAAIVAREFGIPLVDGAIDATKVIDDGRPILVNGSEGFVELSHHME